MSKTVRKPSTAMTRMQHGLTATHDLSTDRNFSENLARGLDVLRAFTAEDRVLSNRELSDRTGLPKPTISRLTYTLTLLGYLSRVEKLQKFRLAAGRCCWHARPANARPFSTSSRCWIPNSTSGASAFGMKSKKPIRRAATAT